MSELKAFDIVVAEEGYCEGIVKYRRAVYDKAEADKVIAELKDKLRHHKYKRCLAMATWCDSENFTACWYHENSERCEWTEKWHKRWLELSEKFKPNNSTAQ